MYIMAEASDLKFGTQPGFAKAHHKITPREKSGDGFGLVELPKILVFSAIFLQRLGICIYRDLKFGTQLGFAKAHHKTTPRGKVGVALDQGSSLIFGVSL